MNRINAEFSVNFDVTAMLEKCNEISTAALAGKEGDEIERMAISMPLFPRAARGLVMAMGKKRFIEKGYDRTNADAAYGADWIDKVEAERLELTGSGE